MYPNIPLRTWWLIFLDLSLDAVWPQLPLMGLARPEDAAFAAELQQGLRGLASPFTSDLGSDRFVPAALATASEKGSDYLARLQDWAVLIYPTHSPLQFEAFRWMAIIRRPRPATDSTILPMLVSSMLEVLAGFPPFLADQLAPASAWDRLYCAERAEDGFSPFEWAQAAVSNFRFRYAWEAATGGRPNPQEVEQLLSWGRRETTGTTARLGELAPPQACLNLPLSLQKL